MTKINVKFIITVAAFVLASVFIGLMILAVSKISSLTDDVANLRSQITQIGNNNQNAIYNNQNAINKLKDELKQQLKEQSENFYDVSYKMLGVHAEDNTADVEVYFSLKESPESGGIKVSYGRDGMYSEVNAVSLATGRFKAVIVLQIDKDYDISYSVVLTGIKTEKLTEVNIFNNLRKRFNADAGFHSENKGVWQLDFSVSNGYFSDDNLKIASGKLEVFKNNTVIKTVNIKNYSVLAGSGYEQFGNKSITINELTHADFDNSSIETRITIVDNYGIEYRFGKD